MGSRKMGGGEGSEPPWFFHPVVEDGSNINDIRTQSSGITKMG